MCAAETNSPKRIALLPGDGVGKEVIAEAARGLRAVAAAGGRKLELTELDWGADRFLRDGTTLPEGGEQMLRDKFDAVLLGALGDPRVPSNKHAADILLGLRFKLDLYINARPVELLDASLTPLRDRYPRDVNFMVFRENTEGLYVGVGGIFKKGTPDEIALQEDVNTRKGVERIIRHAFEYARRNKLTRVCMSDKSNALNFAHDLWQRVFAEVRKEYADVESRHLYIDALAMEVVRDPSQFQVIVTCNLVWRHHQRPWRATCGRHGHGAVGEHSSRAGVHFRTGPRLGAKHRGEKSGESNRLRAGRGDDARARRLARRSGDTSRRGARGCCVQGNHAGCRRANGHARSRRMD